MQVDALSVWMLGLPHGQDAEAQGYSSTGSSTGSPALFGVLSIGPVSPSLFVFLSLSNHSAS